MYMQNLKKKNKTMKIQIEIHTNIFGTISFKILLHEDKKYLLQLYLIVRTH